jgi:oligopeptide transport system ATP-binding protein
MTMKETNSISDGAVISTVGLTKHFRIRNSKSVVSAVNDVSFEIRPGETFGLIGESGSGKTTVGRCLLRLIEPTDGTICFQGKEITHLAAKELRRIRPKMQMVFQQPFLSLNPRERVYNIVDRPLCVLGVGKAERRARVETIADEVGLTPAQLTYYPHQMTEGQQQRVGIARALVTNPDFIVLDEPISTLDSTSQMEIMELFQAEQEKRRIGYLFISHDLTTVQFLCHRVAVIYLSRIVELGMSDDLFRTPRHPYSQALMASALKPDPTVEKGRFLLAGEIPSPVDLPEGCYLASRCPYVVDRCWESYPPMGEVGDGHFAACFRTNEI